MTGPIPDHQIDVSFELFPPKTDAGLETLNKAAGRLAEVGPEYFSVTYGAGGGTRERTARVVRMVAQSTGLPVAHHLTCVGASRAEVDAQARALWDSGIRRIVALRGDLPEGETLAEDGYHDAAELAAGLRKVADFDIAVAAYPEVHPEASSAQGDIDHLKRKLDAGANCAITQYAFETDTVLRFIDRARAAGITAPIVPGIMPVANFASIKRFSEGCGASIPDWMEEMFAGLDEAPDMHAMVATYLAAQQCQRMIDAGIDAFHFYTLNKPDLSLAICRALGIPVGPAKAVAA
ncbi:methylenetetrahydrofolate reductase [NAD(P)H] [Roseovarius sp. D22-M7]|uniref:methylenetetrahydrofolate reductase [NAD(P)H] n=1 Tax=Roseovarius sp. D22-M7 TaxID=3127116 RepID=UPI00300FB978